MIGSGSPLDAARVAEARSAASRARLGPAALRLGEPLVVLPSVASTNDVVRERAAEGAAPGLVVAADRQTAGRGRLGRGFDSRAGLGLWFSVLLPPPAVSSKAARIALVAGIAIAETLEEAAGLRAGVKWPNDVRFDGRKVCGVLVEARSERGVVRPVLGIGVNVHHGPDDFPPEVAPHAVSVEAASGRVVDRSDLLARLLDRLELRLAEDAAGRLDLPRHFAARDDLAGRPVEVREGDAVRWGTATGLDPDGALRLVGPDGHPFRVVAGEASLRG